MRILVLSDTHGDTDIFNTIKQQVHKIDALIHLGDNSKDVEKLREVFSVNVYSIKGNCDFDDENTPEEKIITIKGKKLFLTHGHKYGVKGNLNAIYYKALELEVDIALFGHSHVPICTAHEEILLLNPGSPTLPRGGSKKSYGVIEINDRITGKIYDI